MKNTILCLLVLFPFTIFAQNYYYYKGKKINIVVDRTKAVILSKRILKQSSLSIDSVLTKPEMAKTDYYQIRVKNLQSTELLKNQLKGNADIIALSPVIGENQTTVSNIFYVKLKNSQDYSLLQQFVAQTTCKIERQVDYMPLWYAISIPPTLDKNAIEMANLFYETGYFEEIDPGFQFKYAPNCSSEPSWNLQWGPKMINVCDAWRITKGNSNIMVAVFDTGIDPNHKEFSNNLLSGYDSDSNSTPARTYQNTHGTYVAGIIGANENNEGITGIAPTVTLIPVSSSFNTNAMTSESLARGISWAWQHGACIINNSWGDQGGELYSYMKSALLEDAIQNALTLGRNGLGCVVVFASGNKNGILDYPSYCNDDIICVGNINRHQICSLLSGYGNKLDVVAPGDEIYTTAPLNSFGYASGTSFAAPHVSGIAALMLSVNSGLTQKQIGTIINFTCTKMPNYLYTSSPEHPDGSWDTYVGYGLVNAYKAVKVANLKNEAFITSTDKITYTITDIPEHATIAWETSSSDFHIEKLSDTSVRVLGKDYNKSALLKAKIYFNNICIAEVTKSISSPASPKISGEKQVSCCSKCVNKVEYLPYGATLTWRTAEGMDISSQKGDSINVSVPKDNPEGNWWIEAVVNVNGKTYTARKNLDPYYVASLSMLDYQSTKGKVKKYGFIARAQNPFKQTILPTGNYTLDYNWSITYERRFNGMPAIGVLTKGVETGGRTDMKVIKFCFESVTKPEIEIGILHPTPFGTTYPPIDDPIPYDPMKDIPVTEPYGMRVTLPDYKFTGTLKFTLTDDCGHVYTYTKEITNAELFPASSAPAYTVAPNPANTELIIRRQEEEPVTHNRSNLSAAQPVPVTLNLYNDFGLVRTVRAVSENEEIQMNTADLDNGTYYLNIIRDGEIISRQTVMIRH